MRGTTAVDSARAKGDSARANADAPSDVIVEISGVRKTYRRRDRTVVHALDDVSLTIAKGEFLVLLGPSGCGKSTLLRSIAGLERFEEGEVSIRGQVMASPQRGMFVPPDKRRMSMVFQSYALWPNMNAFDNVAYVLQSRNSRRSLSKSQMAAQVDAVLDTVGVAHLKNQHPGQMSGGQQQRVALARALVARDELVLFDEPLSNVDAKVREQLRLDIQAMQQKLGFTAVYVTHDQAEAMQLADRIVVMREGRIAQIGTPRDVYDRPNSRYVAGFIGAVNELPGTVRAAHNGKVVVDTHFASFEVSTTVDVAPGADVVVAYRPERCRISTSRSAALQQIEGVVRASVYLGLTEEYIVDVAEGTTLRIVTTDHLQLAHGSAVWLEVPEGQLMVFPRDEPAAEGV